MPFSILDFKLGYPFRKLVNFLICFCDVALKITASLFSCQDFILPGLRALRQEAEKESLSLESGNSRQARPRGFLMISEDKKEGFRAGGLSAYFSQGGKVLGAGLGHCRF